MTRKSWISGTLDENAIIDGRENRGACPAEESPSKTTKQPAT